MDLTKNISPEQILVNAVAKDKWDLMRQMLDRILNAPNAAPHGDLSREQIWDLLVDRENKQTTGIGEGFALPHARIDGFKGLGLSLAVLAEGLEFDSLDGRPVRIACMVLTPKEDPTLALKVSSAITSLIIEPATRERLLGARDAQEVYDFLKEKQVKMDIVLTCKDIMRPPLFAVHPDTPLRDVTHMMMRNREEATAVVDQDNRMVGEITGDLLFQYGLPDFFNQLKSVSFISRFDPFEKYFENEAHARAGDLMSKDVPTVPETATLLEVVFALTVKKRLKLYVTREDRLVGVIDRSTVLDRVVNF